MSRPAEIASLIKSVDRYNLANLPVLLTYLETDQVAQGQYDLYANLAILKLYQFNPDAVPSAQEDAPFPIFTMLLKAICHAPFSADVNLCLALLSDQMSPGYASNEVLASYATIQQISSDLLSRKFTAAWSRIQSIQGNSSETALSRSFSSITQFQQILQKSIAEQAIQPLFTTMAVEKFRSWMGLGDKDDLAPVLRSLNWAQEGSVIKISSATSSESTNEESAVPAQPQTNQPSLLPTVPIEKLSKLLKQSVVSAAA